MINPVGGSPLSWFMSIYNPLLGQHRDLVIQSARIVTAVIEDRLIVGNRYLPDLLAVSPVLLGITRFLWIYGIVIIQIDRTASDDDVSAICHVSSPLRLDRGLVFPNDEFAELFARELNVRPVEVGGVIISSPFLLQAGKQLLSFGCIFPG